MGIEIILLVFGFITGYVFCLWLSTLQDRSKTLEPITMDCYDCLKKIAPPEFSFYGGLCKECYQVRHPEILVGAEQ